MNSRDVLPVLMQFSFLLVPLVISLVGAAVARLAIVYNTHVNNQRVRDTVSTIVKAAEMTIAGSADKKAHSVSALLRAFPFLSAEQANRLVEAAVYDMHQWQAQTGFVPPPQAPETAQPPPIPPSPAPPR